MRPMSTGLFMGVRTSYTDESQACAEAFLDAINRVLLDSGIAPYSDPRNPPSVYMGHLFGRSELDHHSSRVLAKIAGVGVESRQSTHLALIRDNPYRTAFLPLDFASPLLTDYRERIEGEPVQIWIGSLPCLLSELTMLAANLGIPLKDGLLTDETARAINDCDPLFDGDSKELAEDERTAWLALYEGARLGLKHNVALSLAG